MNPSTLLRLVIVSGYQRLIAAATHGQSLVILAFRIYWGWQLFLTGKGKLLNHAQVVEFFTSLGIPLPGLNAWFVGGLECVGGILLLLGLASRPVALLMAGNMFVAYISVAEDRVKLLQIFKDPTPFLQADPFFFLLTSVLVLCYGPGQISFDAVTKAIIERCPAKSNCSSCVCETNTCKEGN